MRCFHETVRLVAWRPPLPPAPGRMGVGLDHRPRAARLAVEDATFGEAGMIGLWIKADSVTAFDAFTYEERT